LYAISLLTIGPQSTLPIVVFGKLRFGIDPSINAISTMLFLVSSSLLIAASRLTKLAIE
jgi:spermidine/putrescine transport system permease protein